MRRKKKSENNGFNVWRSYSDMMAGVLLLFVLIMCVTLFQAQKSYNESLQERDEKIALQEEYTQELLDKVCVAMESAAKEKDIAIEVEAQADTLTGDADLLFSLFTNLTDNAIKASPEHTVIRLTASREEDQQSLSVIDQGSGIPADKIALVTEPFYRVDKARSRDGSYGLGLSIAESIVEAHGGKISCEYAQGKANFNVVLPLKQPGVSGKN